MSDSLSLLAVRALALLFLFADVAVAADLQSCLACHRHEQFSEVDIATLREQKCVSCHDHVPEVPVASNSSGAHDIASLPPTGMQYPIYYDKTRIGAEPGEMILIPAGEFTMGSNTRLPDEGPEHKVTLPAYYIDKYEVTNMQYKKFIDATGRKSPSHFKNRTWPPGKVDHPVTFVSWDDADAYCKWAGRRLPTDEEWEKAARGDDARIFPWGNSFDLERANTPQRWAALKAFGDTSPVGSFPSGVSAHGLYDMSGNVWEWTSSWYRAYPGNKTPSESYGERYKTLKGGSWWDCSFYQCGISAPAYNRSFFARKTRNDTFGFRCAKDAEPAQEK